MVSKKTKQTQPSTNNGGGLTNYYLARVDHPQREDQEPYTAECEDIIEALKLDFNEANIFKELWRNANDRLGNGKENHNPIRAVDKILHYAKRVNTIAKRNQPT